MLIKTLENISYQGSSECSILDSGLSSKHVFEYSCKNGQCGVCKTTLLQGEVFELQEQLALSEADKKNKKILTCCCTPKTDILIDVEELSALRGIEIKTLPVRINNIIVFSEHILEVVLRLPPTVNFFFLEGQFIDIIHPDGIRRSYSIANSNHEKTIKLFIKKVEAGVLSQYWFNDAKKNDLLRIEGPKGSFFFREVKENIILMATGTGIAPIKAMLDQLANDSNLYKGVFFSLYWGNRHPEDFFWKPCYTGLNLNYIPVLSREDKDWQGRTGYIQDILFEDDLCMQDTQVYACGSLQMIESASQLLVKNGLQEKYFHSDAFVCS